MSKAEKTREYIIEKAAPVFNIKGYAGTSLGDLVASTGLTKGSIYGNFENKDDVAIEAFKHNIELVGRALDNLITLQATGFNKIIAFTEYYRLNWEDFFQRGGCPILNAAIEADDNLPFLKKHVQLSIKKLASKISRVIDDGKNKNEFKKNIDSTSYAYSIIMVLEGGIMLAKIENNPKHLFAGLDRIKKILHEEILK